jgi:hypothetical protein
MTRSHAIHAAGLLVLVGQFAAVAASTDKTILKRKDAEPEMVDSAAYSRASKEFRLTKGNATFALSEADVEYCKPPKPPELAAPDNVAALEAIVLKYHRLWWDVEAFKRLMPLYVKGGEHAKAIRLYADMRPLIGPSMPVSLQRDYWTALDKAGQPGALQKELTDTLTRGSREASAWAYLARGDALLAQGKRSEALLDGYLKTVMLFEDVASCRKTALGKALQTMQDLGDSRAETFRKMLSEEFP